MPSFTRIPYSVYEIFNSFKLLSQISVTNTTSFLADVICYFSPSSRTVLQPPAHRARECMLLSAETPDFISPLDWPPNSPDLNPVDYAIWDILQERVYHCQIHLKERLIEEWRRFDQNIIDRAVNQWHDRLHKSVRTKGGHFEHLI